MSGKAPERVVLPYDGEDVEYVLASEADEWKRQRDRLLATLKDAVPYVADSFPDIADEYLRAIEEIEGTRDA